MMIRATLFFAIAFTFSACGVEDMTVNLNDSYSCEPPDTIKVEMVRLVNESRAVSRECGEVTFQAALPVTWNSTLEQAAQLHSDDMAANDLADHTGSDGSTAGDRIINSGYTWKIYAENIYGGAQSSKEVVDGWLESPGHCANLMAPDVKEMGAACSRNVGTTYVTYWTQEFAAAYE